MAAKDSIDALDWLRKQVDQAPDPLRGVLVEMVNVLMQAEVDGLCGAGCLEVQRERLPVQVDRQAVPDGRLTMRWSRPPHQGGQVAPASSGRLAVLCIGRPVGARRRRLIARR